MVTLEKISMKVVSLDIGRSEIMLCINLQSMIVRLKGSDIRSFEI